AVRHVELALPRLVAVLEPRVAHTQVCSSGLPHLGHSPFLISACAAESSVSTPASLSAEPLSSPSSEERTSSLLILFHSLTASEYVRSASPSEPLSPSVATTCLPASTAASSAAIRPQVALTAAQSSMALETVARGLESHLA